MTVNRILIKAETEDRKLFSNNTVVALNSLGANTFRF